MSSNTLRGDAVAFRNTGIQVAAVKAFLSFTLLAWYDLTASEDTPRAAVR